MRKSEDDELGRSNSSHTDFHDHAAFQDIESCHRFTEPHCDIERVFGLYALQSALSPKDGKKVLDHRLHAHPGIGVVWLEDELLGGFLARLFGKNEKPAHVYVTLTS